MKVWKAVVCAAVIACGMAMAASAAFTDVPANAWYAEAVNELADKGILSGKTATVFDPQGKVTRAEFVKMLALSSGDDLTGLEDKKQYNDNYTQQILLDAADSSLWFTAYANWGYDKWVVNGDDNGNFLPQKAIARQEAASMLNRYLAYRYSALTKTGGVKAFTDKAAIAAWAKEDVDACVSYGVMTGYPDGSFGPGNSITRAEAAKMVREAMFENTVVTKPAAKASFSDALQALAGDSSKNYTLSPYSVRLALAMTANGANGETKQQLLDALQITDLSAFNTKVKAQLAAYETYGDLIQLKVADSIWVNTDAFQSTDADFQPAYKKTLAEYYQAEAAKVTSNTLETTINQWCADKTNQKIKSIIPPAPPSAWDKTAGVLANAVYFKGTWAQQFSEKQTAKGSFTDASGKVTQTDLMNQLTSQPYYAEPGVQVLQMPYETVETDENGSMLDRLDADISMYIILTDEPDYPVENLLSSIELKSRRVRITLPKFKIEYDKTLNESFQKMNAVLPFDRGKADFHSMFDEQFAVKQFWIDSILHKTYIDVNEKGTEAAAVTVVMMGAAGHAPSRAPAVVEFRADHPFYFAIRDDGTGEILFVGRYAYVK